MKSENLLHNHITRTEEAIADQSEATPQFRFPELERLLLTPHGAALPHLRTRLSHTCHELERVIRQGSQTDAERAQKALQAWGQTLSFLDELEVDLKNSRR